VQRRDRGEKRCLHRRELTLSRRGLVLGAQDQVILPQTKHPEALHASSQAPWDLASHLQG